MDCRFSTTPTQQGPGTCSTRLQTLASQHTWKLPGTHLSSGWQQTGPHATSGVTMQLPLKLGLALVVDDCGYTLLTSIAGQLVSNRNAALLLPLGHDIYLFVQTQVARHAAGRGRACAVAPPFPDCHRAHSASVPAYGGVPHAAGNARSSAPLRLWVRTDSAAQVGIHHTRPGMLIVQWA
jgi:hypothetical protein